jgi:hypothetical protein
MKSPKSLPTRLEDAVLEMMTMDARLACETAPISGGDTVEPCETP